MGALKPSRQDRKRILTLQVDVPDHEQLKQLAAKNDRSVSAEARIAIRAHLKKAA